MTRQARTILIRRYTAMATDCARWVCLNPQNAATWRAEAAKLRALAAALEVDAQIAAYRAA